MVPGSLSGLDYSSGFSSERILHEYEVALNTVILAEQQELMEPVRAILRDVAGIDPSSLEIINRPPTRSKPIYMKVWEARKARRPGLRPRRRTPAGLPVGDNQIQRDKDRLNRAARRRFPAGVQGRAA